MKAEEQETIKKRSVYKKSVEKLLALRSIKKGGKSFGELTLDLAKQHVSFYSLTLLQPLFFIFLNQHTLTSL